MLLALGIFISSFLSTPSEDARVKALYMYTFLRNMEWPTDKPADKYVIAVVGDISVIQQLEAFTGNKHINGRKVEIVNYTSEVLLEEVNVLFLSKDLAHSFESFYSETMKNSVVLVTESKGLARKGAAVNFVTKEDRISFEINTTTLEKLKVRASSTITESAKLVN